MIEVPIVRSVAAIPFNQTIPPEAYSVWQSPALLRQIFEKQVDIDTRKEIITDLAKNMFGESVLTHTTWIECIDLHDIETIFTFFERAIPFSDPLLQSGYWKHLSASYARSVAASEVLFEDTPQKQYLLQARVLLHDVGRLFDAQDYRLNDMLAHEFMIDVGFCDEFTQGFLPLDRILGLELPIVRTIDEFDKDNIDLDREIMLLDICDNLGRFDNRTNILLSVDQCLEYISTQGSRNPLRNFEEQRMGIKAIENNHYEAQQRAMRLVVDGITRFSALLSDRGSSFEQFERRSQEVFNHTIPWAESAQKVQTFNIELLFPIRNSFRTRKSGIRK